MRRLLLLALLALATAAVAVPAAWAGSAHFIFVDLTKSGNTLTVNGKEAGLGNLAQVHIEVTATALCINSGGNHPKAVNKTNVSAGSNFPVQNGKADFSLTATATFQPSCSPPMTVEFHDITVADTTNGISVFFPDP